LYLKCIVKKHEEIKKMFTLIIITFTLFSKASSKQKKPEKKKV